MSNESSSAASNELLCLRSQVRRLMAERDALLGAISPMDYDKVKAQLESISESPGDK